MLAMSLVDRAAPLLLTGAFTVSSHFDRGSAGWSIVDLNCSSYAPLGVFSVDWLPVGGDPDGYVRRLDRTGNCYFFEAPAAFRGNQLAVSGGVLRFSLTTTVNDWPPGPVLLLVGNGVTLIHHFDLPDSQWGRYAVPLTPGSFTLLNGSAISQSTLEGVLSDLDALRISAEYGSELGEELTSLDTVILSTPACYADFDGNGEIDGADLGLLLGEWDVAGSYTDINADGITDGADLGLLLGAWGGCS